MLRLSFLLSVSGSFFLFLKNCEKSLHNKLETLLPPSPFQDIPFFTWFWCSDFIIYKENVSLYSGTVNTRTELEHVDPIWLYFQSPLQDKVSIKKYDFRGTYQHLSGHLLANKARDEGLAGLSKFSAELRSSPLGQGLLYFLNTR